MSLEAVIAERDRLWDQYLAEVANPRSYGAVRKDLERRIEALNEQIAAREVSA
jgi:hypothetical protein